MMVWREPKNHFDDCYFCLVDLNGFNCHKKSIWNYPDSECVWQLGPHCEEVPVPKFSDLPDITMEYDEFQEKVKSSASDSDGNGFESSLSTPEQFKQEELSDLIRNLNLCKEAAEIWHPGSKTKSASELEFQ